MDTSSCFLLERFQTKEIKLAKLRQIGDSVYNFSVPLVADLDNDCNSEIIIKGSRYNSLLIYNANKSTLYKEIFTPNLSSEIGIIDINNDNIFEIIVRASQSGINSQLISDRLLCYDFYGNLLWVSNSRININSNTNFETTIGFTDFNHDGVTEIFLSNQIFHHGKHSPHLSESDNRIP